MSPDLDGNTIVRLATIASAPLGMLQLPWMRKKWDGPADSGDPLVCGPTVRVSKTRQGLTLVKTRPPAMTCDIAGKLDAARRPRKATARRLGPKCMSVPPSSSSDEGRRRVKPAGQQPRVSGAPKKRPAKYAAITALLRATRKAMKRMVIVSRRSPQSYSIIDLNVCPIELFKSNIAICEIPST